MSIPKPDEIEPLVDLMCRRGMRVLAFESLRIELDPAAQYLNAPRVEPEQDEAARAAAGLCKHPGCDGKSGWLKTPYCRRHFQVAMSGRAS